MKFITSNSVFSSEVLKHCVNSCICFLVALLLFGCQKDGAPIPTFEDGYVDFSNWDFEKNGVVSLKEIEIWSSDNRQSPQKISFIEYKLKIKLPETPQIWALKLVSDRVPFSLWLDDQLLIQNEISQTVELLLSLSDQINRFDLGMTGR